MPWQRPRPAIHNDNALNPMKLRTDHEVVRGLGAEGLTLLVLANLCMGGSLWLGNDDRGR